MSDEYPTMTLKEQINLVHTPGTCDDKCKQLMEYCEDYLSQPCQGYRLALIDLRDYKDADDYFARGYHATARNRMRKAQQTGWTAREMTGEEWNARRDEIHAIQHSTPVRQGGPMSQQFDAYPALWTGTQCPAHRRVAYGAFAPDGLMVGYKVIEHCGELVITDSFMGHAEHMKRAGFMLLLWWYVVANIMSSATEVKYTSYHLWDVGTPGLRQWKHQVGLRPYVIEQYVNKGDENE